jgi:hypothetical protein
MQTKAVDGTQSPTAFVGFSNILQTGTRFSDDFRQKNMISEKQ